MRRLALFASCLLGLTAFAACRPTQLPGESLGQYRISGTLVENTCGEGHPAPESFSFHVELRAERQGSRGYWKLPEGPAVPGNVSPAGAFRFEQRDEVVAIPEDLPNWVTGCMVERLEIVAGNILRSVESDGGQPDAGRPDADPSGAEPGALRGTTTVTVSPLAGSDCSPLLLPNGGAFPVLPCQLRWELTGERLAQPLW